MTKPITPTLFDSAEGAQVRERRLQSNVKRWQKTKSFRQKNQEIMEDIEKVQKTVARNVPEWGNYLEKFHSNLESCGKFSLFRKYYNPSHTEYISTFLCGHKCCTICNSTRCKHVRRKYSEYFERDKFVQRKDWVDTDTGEIIEAGRVFHKDDFDFMHLTLTVPHTKKGWRGKEVYARELIAATNRMRKEKQWLKYVWGGEFGVEFTRGDNGLHIHTHALLIVRKSKNSRNELAKVILQLWNKHTVDEGSNRKKWDRKRRQVKYKMWRDKKNANGEWITMTTAENELQTIGRTYQMDMWECDLKLDPRGSTLITLESLYIWNKDKSKKIYVKDHSSKYFMPAVMECIKYHFEPLCLDDATGRVDIGLLLMILNDIRHLPLYKKFGNLHGEKSLNIKAQVAEEEYADNIKEYGDDVAVHPLTGETQKVEDYDYYITLSDKVQRRIVLPDNCGPLRANNTFHAIKQLMGCAIADYSERKMQRSINNYMEREQEMYEKMHA